MTAGELSVPTQLFQTLAKRLSENYSVYDNLLTDDQESIMPGICYRKQRDIRSWLQPIRRRQNSKGKCASFFNSLQSSSAALFNLPFWLRFVEHTVCGRALQSPIYMNSLHEAMIEWKGNPTALLR